MTGHESSVKRRLASARQGAADDQARFLDAYRPYLLQIARDLVRGALQTKVGGSDLVQQSLVEASQSMPEFRGQSEQELLAWLRRILLNNYANLRRRYGEGTKRDLNCEEPAQVNDLRSPDKSPDREVEATEEARQLDLALSELSTEYELVIRMRHEHKLSFVEMATLFGRSPDAVRKLWVRAVKALQARLSN